MSQKHSSGLQVPLQPGFTMEPGYVILDPRGHIAGVILDSERNGDAVRKTARWLERFFGWRGGRS